MYTDCTGALTLVMCHQENATWSNIQVANNDESLLLLENIQHRNGGYICVVS